MRKQEKNLFYLSAFSLLFFILTLLFIKLGMFTQVDSLINQWVKENSLPALLLISTVIGYIFEPIIAIIISFMASIFLWFKDSKRDSLLFAIIAAISGMLIFSLKELVHRVRPENIVETNFSFPSGHATFAVILFGFLIYLARKNIRRPARIWIYIILSLMILFVGFSRLLLQVHWFSDVLGGLFLGLAVISSGFFIERRLFGRGGD